MSSRRYSLNKVSAKRQNFINIQQSHTIACNGYHVMPVRTGEESVIANRVGDAFAYIAKGNGTVTKVTPEAVQVTYEDGTVKGIEIGRRFSAAAGLTIPHHIVTVVKEGQKVKSGDIVTYNDGFFERDPLQPDVLAYKGGLLATVAVYETSMTDEDSSTVSKRLASQLKTKTAKPRDITFTFDQGINHLVKVGQEVEPTDVLCLIEDAVSMNSTAIDKESLDTLMLLGSQTPLAKVKGVVERIEVYYHGDKEDMSESLRKLVTTADRERAAKLKALAKPVTTGQVDAGYRYEGESLMPDTLVVRIFITSDVILDTGDKVVFANQMKSVVGKVMDEPMLAEDGTEIDAEFGRRSIAARIVNSPDVIGTTTTLLEVIGKKAFEIYKK